MDAHKTIANGLRLFKILNSPKTTGDGTMPSPQTAKEPAKYPMANAEQKVLVSAAALPLHCPMPGSALWASHPRVYLPIQDKQDGQMLCPYCGTLYVLEDS